VTSLFADSAAHPKKTVIWFISFVLFVWLNQTNRINQMNQIDQMDQTDQSSFLLGLSAVGIIAKI
jgi:hypothetical protein